MYHQNTQNYYVMLKQVYRRLDEACLGIVYPLEFCDDGVIYEHNTRYLSSQYHGDQIAASTGTPGIDDMTLLSMFRFGIESIAPCVARQGLVFFDVTPQHMVLQDGGDEPFQMYDVGSWRCREWYHSTVQEATKQNQHIIREAFQHLLDEQHVGSPMINQFLQTVPAIQWDQSDCCWWGGQQDPWAWMWSKFEPEMPI